MTEFVLLSSIWMMGMTAGVWMIPKRRRMDFVAIASGGFLFLWSPLGATALLAGTILMWMITKLPKSQARWSGPIVMVAMVGWFVYVRLQELELSGFHLVGIGYTVLRQLHLLADVRLGRIQRPSLRDCLRYQFFLPVIGAGPIHRFQTFHREQARHRWDRERFAEGVERILFGAAKICVIGDYLLARHLGAQLGAPGLAPPIDAGFLHVWLASAAEWLHLYVQFSGLTDVAVGFSRMMGLRIEENFNHPWRARDLADFWLRWHMTLSHWCRDYVFAPISAWTRQAWLGLATAMLTLGFWHQIGAYYVIWAAYHAIGIAATRRPRQKQGPSAGNEPDGRGLLTRIFTGILLLAWLAGARPIITIWLGISK